MPVVPGTSPEIFVLASLVHVVPESGTHQLVAPCTPFIPTDRLAKLSDAHWDGEKFPVSTTPNAALAFACGSSRMLSP
jgi:hypothetical protein